METKNEFEAAVETLQKAMIAAIMVPEEYLCHAPIYPNFSRGMAYLEEQNAKHQTITIRDRFTLVVDQRIKDDSWRLVAP